MFDKTDACLLQVSTNPVMTQVSVQGADSPAPADVNPAYCGSDVNTSADEEGSTGASAAVELGMELAHHNYCELAEIKEEIGEGVAGEEEGGGALIIDQPDPPPPPPPQPAQCGATQQVKWLVVHIHARVGGWSFCVDRFACKNL